MTKASKTLAKALAIEVSKDADYEDIYQAAIQHWTQEFQNYDVEQLRYDFEEKYDYLFEE